MEKKLSQEQIDNIFSKDFGKGEESVRDAYLNLEEKNILQLIQANWHAEMEMFTRTASREHLNETDKKKFEYVLKKTKLMGMNKGLAKELGKVCFAIIVPQSRNNVGIKIYDETYTLDEYALRFRKAIVGFFDTHRFSSGGINKNEYYDEIIRLGEYAINRLLRELTRRDTMFEVGFICRLICDICSNMDIRMPIVPDEHKRNMEAVKMDYYKWGEANKYYYIIVN